MSLYIWFFSSVFFVFRSFFVSEFTCTAFIWWTNSSVKFKKFHCRNELKQNTMNNISEKESEKRTQFENKFYSNSNKWAADKSIAAQNCIHFENLKSVCRLHIIRWCTLYNLNDQDSWCTWSIRIRLDFYFIACENKMKCMESILNAISHSFGLSDWSVEMNQCLKSRGIGTGGGGMVWRHHLILFLI